MKPLLRQGAIGALLLAAVLTIAPLAGQSHEVGKRRVLTHSNPPYPELARSMALEGVVKVDALVAPDGSVKATEVKGGHPVLVQAAINAVRSWKWEPSAHESHEVVAIRFSLEQ